MLRRNKINISVILLFSAMLFTSTSVFASANTVQEQEPKYRYVTRPSEVLFIQNTPSVDRLISNVTAGIIQGVDTNPLLDSTKKADNYTQETLDMHFKYPVFGSFLGFTNSKFGFNINNINYYNITDVNIMDSSADIGIEQEIFDKVVLGTGYTIDLLWFPNDEDGTFLKNEFNVTVKHNITDWLYQKGTYKIAMIDYLYRKIRMGNGTNGSDLRFDVRNTLEHEIGIYYKSSTKVRITNQFYINDSNDQYFDYYSYYNYRFGTSLTHFFNKKLYSITGFYYQRRNYMSRIVSDRIAREHDNLFLVTQSVLFDVTKNVSIFVNYSHSENHTNEPLEKYSDTLYTAGLYYAF